MSKRKKKKAYKRGLLIYVLIMLILMVFALIYVTKSLINYEQGDVNNYMDSLVKKIKLSAKLGNIDEYIDLPDISSKYENSSSLIKGYKELFSSKNVTYKKNGIGNIFDIYVDEKIVATVKLKELRTEHRLGLLTYSVYGIDEITANNKNGLYNYDIYINAGNKLYINGIEAKDDDKIDSSFLSEYDEVKELVNLPQLNHYKIDNLTSKPEIKIIDLNDNIVEYRKEDNNIYADNYFHTDDLNEANTHLAHEIDPLKVAETYSLFLTTDNLMSGESTPFNMLTPYLIENTNVYNKLRAWATGIDRTFTSLHVNDKETFTGEYVKNITIYDENTLSAEVYLEKNMTLAGNQKKKDILHEMYYFVYYNDGYKLVYNKSVTEG